MRVGCFSFSLLTRENNWKIVFRFHIGLHKTDLIILEAIKAEFKTGKIYIQKTRDHAYFVVQSIEALKNIIIPYFAPAPSPFFFNVVKKKKGRRREISSKNSKTGPRGAQGSWGPRHRVPPGRFFTF